MASKTASFPVIGLGLDPSGITKGLNAARNILKSGMNNLWSGISTPAFGVALANQAAEFTGKLTRLFGEPFRQLMEQEDLTSKFSLAAGGATNAGKAFDDLRSISRETGVAMQDMAQGLETLLQGQFSFDGAKQQIADLAAAATVLGAGSLPMLAQAAAKFRAGAFAGFEDINQVAAQGLPIYEALAQRLGVSADEARRLAKEGMVTGLQAREALNAAANGAAVKGAGGAQEQTLSGMLSRLREGVNQTLALIGDAVARAVDVPSLLARFRGFVEGIRTVLEAALGPLNGALGANGQGLKEKFQAAQQFTIDALKAVSDGFFSFLRGLESVVNQFRKVIEYLASWLPEKFTEAQEAQIAEFRKANQVRIQREVVGRGGELIKQAPQVIDLPRDQAIKALRDQGKLPALPAPGADIDLGIAGMQKRVNEALNAADKKLFEANRVQAQALAKAADEAAAAQKRQVEAQNQAKDALMQFTAQFAQSFETPVDAAMRKLQQLDALKADAQAKGVELTDQQKAQVKMGEMAIGQSLTGLLQQQTAMLNQAKESVALAPSSVELISSIARAQSRESSTGANVQQQIANYQRQTVDEQRKQNLIGQQVVDTLRAILAKPPVAQVAARI